MVINGHNASIILEQPFWVVLHAIADVQHKTVSALPRQTDASAVMPTRRQPCVRLCWNTATQKR